jgi:hypothetical protein
MKVLDARLTYFIDNLGKRYANAPDLDLLVDHIPCDKDLHWNFYKNAEGKGMFLAEKDGFYRTYFHDGSKENFGGLGGATIELPTSGGSIYSIRGPWCGNPKQAKEEFGIPTLIDVTLHEGSYLECGIGNFWAGISLVTEALKMVRFPDSSMLRAVLMLDNRGPGLQEYDFAIIKRSGGDGREAPKLVRAEW